MIQAIKAALRKIRDVFSISALVKRVEEVEQLQQRAETAKAKYEAALGEITELNKAVIGMQTQNIHIHTTAKNPCEQEVKPDEGTTSK